MHSPLPDSSALEAGIIEDNQPSRLSRVQDNVRNLLRSSMLGSVRSSPRSASPELSPQAFSHFPYALPVAQPEILPSPTASVSTTASTDSSQNSDSAASHHSTDVLIPPVSYHQAVREMAHQSALFNTRAIAALSHPDLEDTSFTASLEADTRRKQRRAWKRSSQRELHNRLAGSQILLCVIVGLALSGLLATYIALATTSTQAPPIFHILFVLGIILVGIAFIHSVARLLFVPTQIRHKQHSKSRHHRHHEHRHHGRRRTTRRVMPSRDDHFVPPTPIEVVISTDNVRLDPNEAAPSSAVHQPPEVWDKASTKDIVNPPPAYGRWRGSVRADPELLHWQAIPSPTNEEMSSIPSPTYEESSQAEVSAGSPPSYTTREGPVRTVAGHTRTVVEDRPGDAQAQSQPEMIEGRGIGLAQ